MMESDDYHDYVIRDGEFVGAFEEMYQNCSDPWHQDSGFPLKKRIAITVARHYREQYDSAMDLGCGKGNFTKRVQSSLACHTVGLDTSPTAVSTAKLRYPDVDFLCSELPPIPCKNATFDLVVVSELLWYVLPAIDTLFDEIERVLKSSGACLILQHFPADQSYGNEVMSNPDDLLSLVGFPTLEHVEVYDDEGIHMIGLFSAT